MQGSTNAERLWEMKKDKKRRMGVEDFTNERDADGKDGRRMKKMKDKSQKSMTMKKKVRRSSGEARFEG